MAIYTGKLAQRIPATADEAAIRRAHGEAFRLLLKHYFPEKPDGDAMFALAYALARAHVPAFQVAPARKNAPDRWKLKAPQDRSPAEQKKFLKEIYRRLGMSPPRGPREKGRCDPNAPLPEQHPLQLVRTVDAVLAELVRLGLSDLGGVNAVIDAILRIEARKRRKIIAEYLDTHSRNLQKRYSKAKRAAVA